VPEAVALIARAADGSVRDGLSMLDQAIAHGSGEVSAEQVRDMLGLADRIQVFDLFETVMKGDIAAALDRIDAQYAMGVDPGMLISDMLDLTHWLTRVKLAPNGAADPSVPEAERERGRQMAASLSMAALTRAWQMLLKGLGEVRGAPAPLQAAEMVLVRLAYASELPTPAEAIEQMRGKSAGPTQSPPAPIIQTTLGGPSTMHATDGSAAIAHPKPVQTLQSREPVALARDPTEGALVPVPVNFPALVELLASRREALLAAHLSADVHLVHYEPGRLEFRSEAAAPANLATRLSRLLSDWTGRAWMVSLSHEIGAPTLREQGLDRELRRREDAASLPLVQAILNAFPGATIESVKDLAGSDTVADDDDERMARVTLDLEADRDGGDEA
jgi:DNA polymerase-3 subunit gamma/tau